jgi:hypothetical protein
MDEKLFNRLKILINKTYYTNKRYKIPATFAYLYHEKELSLDDLGKYVRKSDHFLKIDENHYFIHFAYTEQDHAFKACQNLLLYLDKHFNNTSSYIAVDTFDATKSPTVVFNRLQQILDRQF